MNLCAYCISVAYMDACVSGFVEVVASFQPAAPILKKCPAKTLAGHFLKNGGGWTLF